MAYCPVGPRRIHVVAAFKKGLDREGVEAREPFRETLREFKRDITHFALFVTGPQGEQMYPCS